MMENYYWLYKPKLIQKMIM